MIIYYSVKTALLAYYLWLVVQLVSVMSQSAKTFFYGVLATTFMVVCPKKVVDAAVNLFTK